MVEGLCVMLYHNVSFRIHWQLEKIHTCPTSVAPMDFGGRSLPGILIATWVASYRLIHMQVGWAGEGGGCLTAALLDQTGILLLGCFGDPKNWAKIKGKFECVKCHSRISRESQSAEFKQPKSQVMLWITFRNSAVTLDEVHWDRSLGSPNRKKGRWQRS